MAPVPLDGLRQSHPEIRPRLKTEFTICPRCIEHTPWLSVRFRFVPDDPAFESGQLHDQTDEVPNGDFKARPDIHRIALVVSFHGKDDSFSRILHIKKFPRCLARAPDDNLSFPAANGIDASS